MKATRTCHGRVHMFTTHRHTLTLQLHNFDLFKTCRTALLHGNWQDFNWHDASRGPSAIAEFLVKTVQVNDRTCNSDIVVCRIRITLVLGKNLTKHGLGWVAALCHECEWAPVFYIHYIDADLSQCWHSSVQLATWFVTRNADNNITTAHLLQTAAKLSGGIRLQVSVKMAWLLNRATGVSDGSTSIILTPRTFGYVPNHDPRHTGTAFSLTKPYLGVSCSFPL